MNKSILLILSGGSGKRVSQLTAGTPKQFFCFADKTTLLGNTFVRLKNLQLPIGIITQVQQLSQLQVLQQGGPDFILAEAQGHNTAAAIAFAVLQLEKLGLLEAVFAFLPCDQLFDNESAFLKTLQIALELAKAKQQLVLIGCRSQKINSNLGYFKLDAQHQLIEFVEKPDATKMATMSAQEYFANCGIFVAKGQVFKQLLQQFAPEYQQFARVIDSSKTSLLPLSFDQAVLQKGAPAVGVIGDFQLIDLGQPVDFLHFKQQREV